MNQFVNKEFVSQQYQKTDNLKTRISIHDLYSTNPQGFGNWIIDHYQFAPHARVLEVGCGTASMWTKHLDMVKDLDRLVLSDAYEAMVVQARVNLEEGDKLHYMVADVQSLPFDRHSFDVVIANMMLYHVPDLNRGLREITRVLRPGGTFYAATYGENGIGRFLTDLFREFGVKDDMNTYFSLQNGASILQKHFINVKRLDYPDSLRVTKLEDMADYIRSMSTLQGFAQISRDTIIKKLRERLVDDVLHIPKEYGLFICR